MPHPNDRPRAGRGRFVRATTTAERDAEAAELRSQGLTFKQIADTLGIDIHSAYDAVQRALRAIVQEPAEELRRLELDRLDTLQRAAMDILERSPDMGALQAVDRLLRISESRRKLLGLDAPTRVDATVHEVTQQDLALQELVNELKAKNAAVEAQLNAGGRDD